MRLLARECENCEHVWERELYVDRVEKKRLKIPGECLSRGMRYIHRMCYPKLEYSGEIEEAEKQIPSKDLQCSEITFVQ